jgi:hypothetical protein
MVSPRSSSYILCSNRWSSNIIEFVLTCSLARRFEGRCFIASVLSRDSPSISESWRGDKSPWYYSHRFNYVLKGGRRNLQRIKGDVWVLCHRKPPQPSRQVAQLARCVARGLQGIGYTCTKSFECCLKMICRPAVNGVFDITAWRMGYKECFIHPVDENTTRSSASPYSRLNQIQEKSRTFPPNVETYFYCRRPRHGRYRHGLSPRRVAGGPRRGQRCLSSCLVHFLWCEFSLPIALSIGPFREVVLTYSCSAALVTAPTGA